MITKYFLPSREVNFVLNTKKNLKAQRIFINHRDAFNHSVEVKELTTTIGDSDLRLTLCPVRQRIDIKFEMQTFIDFHLCTDTEIEIDIADITKIIKVQDKMQPKVNAVTKGKLKEILDHILFRYMPLPQIFTTHVKCSLIIIHVNIFVNFNLGILVTWIKEQVQPFLWSEESTSEKQ